jgi:hypothetical protein
MVPTRFKNTTGNGMMDFLIDMLATSTSVFYWAIGEPGKSFEAAMNGEATKSAWAQLTMYLKAAFGTLFCFVATGLVMYAGKGVGYIFSGMGVYAPPPPGVVV